MAIAITLLMPFAPFSPIFVISLSPGRRFQPVFLSARRCHFHCASPLRRFTPLSCRFSFAADVAAAAEAFTAALRFRHSAPLLR